MRISDWSSDVCSSDLDEFTGTAILSYKPVDDLMVYASYSRGYKAGGFNLDRSALKSPILPFAAVGGAQGLVGAPQLDPETVDTHEIAATFYTGLFRSEKLRACKAVVRRV